ncbi:MAG TPA: hypothetical protein VIX73_33000 [Kofleriaceae bacterium]|jgi:hypothetical protein
MTVRKEDGRWFYRRWVRLGDRKTRIYGTPRRFNLPNTRAGAEEAERRAIQEVLDDKPRTQATPASVPTVAEFTPIYMQHSRAKNKPRSVNSKEQILRDHLSPVLGAKRSMR